MRDIVKQSYQCVDDAHLATTADDQTSQRRGMRTARLLLRRGHAEDYRVHGHRRSCRPMRHLVPSSSTPHMSGCFSLSPLFTVLGEMAGWARIHARVGAGGSSAPRGLRCREQGGARRDVVARVLTGAGDCAWGGADVGRIVGQRSGALRLAGRR